MDETKHAPTDKAKMLDRHKGAPLTATCENLRSTGYNTRQVYCNNKETLTGYTGVLDTMAWLNVHIENHQNVSILRTECDKSQRLNMYKQRSKAGEINVGLWSYLRLDVRFLLVSHRHNSQHEVHQIERAE